MLTAIAETYRFSAWNLKWLVEKVTRLSDLVIFEVFRNYQQHEVNICANYVSPFDKFVVVIDKYGGKCNLIFYWILCIRELNMWRK